MKIREVVDRILAYHPQFPADYDGCDNYKCGDPEAECTGVVTALVPTVEVIRKAIELKANLIVVHEPTFYTSFDGPGWYQNFGNSVYDEKRKLLDDNGIVIWRDHDHIHAHDPDGIFTGVLKHNGWLQKAEKRTDAGMFAHYVVRFEPMKLKELVKLFLDKYDINGVRYIGDPEAEVSSFALIGHLYPMGDMNNEYSVNVIKCLEEDVDVIIPGETIDWTVLSYLRDAVQLGRNKGMISIGHFNSEEYGMEYMRDWLDELCDHQVEVTYVESRDIFSYAMKEK